jgi:hypothetical protein
MGAADAIPKLVAVITAAITAVPKPERILFIFTPFQW